LFALSEDEIPQGLDVTSCLAN